MQTISKMQAAAWAILLISLSGAASQNRDAAIINKFIAAQAREVRGQEYREARHILRGDLNKDGVADVAVLYTLEGMGGGNNYVQYLAVFVRQNGELVAAAHAPVGGKLQRDVTLEAIRDNLIICKTLSYAKNDPACCPTKKGSARFALVDGTLKEQ